MSVSGVKNFLFRQLSDKQSSTYTYLLAHVSSKEAIVIDPVIEQVERDAEQIDSLNLNLIYAINTHLHADHVTGTGLLKKKYPKCKSVIGAKAGAKADWLITKNDKINFGNFSLQVFETPGHTDGCVTYYFKEAGIAFTGDALMIRGCGRTDFQEGSASTLYDSNWKYILSLPDDTQLFPAHDYKGRTVTTVAEEKKLNPRLTKSKEEFIKIMDNLNLPYPAQIDRAVPGNKVCGVFEVDETSAKK